jgi:hypothetical protein
MRTLQLVLLVFMLFPAMNCGTGNAEEMICGNPRDGQYAKETYCMSVALLPDGSEGNGDLVASIPDSYPWLFRLGEGETPVLSIETEPKDMTFSTLQFVNGYAPYETDGSETTPYESYGRARKVEIKTGAGHKLTVELADKPELQFVQLPEPAAHSSLTIRIISAYPGKKDIVALRWASIAWEAE